VLAVVPGNHDFFASVEDGDEPSSRRSHRFLRNERVIVAGKLLVYGVDDPMGERLGFEAANVDQVVGPDACAQPSILLCHQPIGYARLAALGVGSCCPATLMADKCGHGAACRGSEIDRNRARQAARLLHSIDA
jgi:hypothetical protein